MFPTGSAGFSLVSGGDLSFGLNAGMANGLNSLDSSILPILSSAAYRAESAPKPNGLAFYLIG